MLIFALMRHLFFVLLILIVSPAISQDFINNDLDGSVTGVAALPNNWQSVPYNDIHCNAFTAFTATPDLTDINGPGASSGILGMPSSGSTFVSGNIAQIGVNVFHEGIMQTVSGFTTGCSYTINFYQTVVKQDFAALDTSGAWQVIVDNTPIATTAPSVSYLPYDATALVWEFRSISFIASSASHTIKFLPIDDDIDLSPNSVSGGVRMGIDSIYITGSLPSNILVNDTINSCIGDTITLDATASNASYLWGSNVWQVGGSTDPIFQVTQSGTYWVEATDGCSITKDTMVVIFNPLPLVNLGNDLTLCPGEIATLNPSVNSATYLWQDNSTSSTFNVSTQGTYWVEATVSNCSARDTVQIDYNQLPMISLGADTTVCQGTNVLLDATSPSGNYLWSDNSTNPTFNTSQAGIYWVQVANACDTLYDTINVLYDAYPIVDLGSDTILCHGDILSLDVNFPNATYMWNDNSSVSIRSFTQSGFFWVDVFNTCGTARDDISITYREPLSINLGNDTTICQDQLLLLDAGMNTDAKYRWQNNSEAPIFMVAQPGLYQVEITNLCETISESITVRMENCNCQLYIPNAFTPNNDSFNAAFQPISSCDLEKYKLIIFNKWGEELFETINPSESWDGTHQGMDLPVDIYTYSVSYRFEGIKDTIRQGSIALIR